MLPNHPHSFRILVIDDNPAIHADFGKVLSPPAPADGAIENLEAELFGAAPLSAIARVHFQIDSAHQGRDGLALVQQSLSEGQPYAMAFVDVRMPPGWDGIETIAEIWRIHPDLQVVLCTAYSDYSWEELRAKLGTTDQLVILKKPFDNVEVLQLAHALCEKWLLLQRVRARMSDLEEAVAERTATLQEMNLKLEDEIEERRHTEAALRESQAMVLRQERLAAVGQLSAGVAHDFNNIMTIIQGYAEMIIAAEGCSQEWTRAMHEIMVAAVRAGKLTQQLLAFSRKQVMRCRNVNPVDMVTDFGSMLSRVLGERVALQFDYAASVPQIFADTALLEQVLMNLAVNARDAMPEGGDMKITIAPVEVGPERAERFHEAVPGHFVCFTVSDTGCGMEEAVLKRVFEPFFTTKDVGKGTGLGLATAYGIVKQHKGWIEVESAVGRGTTFRFFVPAVPSVASIAATEKASSSGARGNGEVILVVEDEPSVRSLVKSICLRSGYSVIEATTGDEALEIFQRAGEQVDLVLTDMVMPGATSGKELADRLRAQKPGLKVIFTSGYSREADKDFLSEGVNFLHKPYHPPTLRDMIHRFIQARN
jgi:two-component system NtrC family sensor kinase